MRVLLISGSYPPMKCGVGDYTARLARSLQDYTDIKVSVLTSAMDAPNSLSDGPELYRVVTTWGRSGLIRFFSVMRRIQPDVVHIQFPTQGYDSWSGLAAIALFSRIRWHVPVVATLHEFLPRTVYSADRWIHLLA